MSRRCVSLCQISYTHSRFHRNQGSRHIILGLVVLLPNTALSPCPGDSRLGRLCLRGNANGAAGHGRHRPEGQSLRSNSVTEWKSKGGCPLEGETHCLLRGWSHYDLYDKAEPTGLVLQELVPFFKMSRSGDTATGSHSRLRMQILGASTWH